MQITNRAAEFSSLVTVVADEEIAFNEILPSLKSSVGCRVVVRNTLAAAEAITHQVKMCCLSLIEDIGGSQHDELKTKLERKYGGPTFKERLKTSMNGFHAVMQTGETFDMGGPGWAMFNEAISIRDRITHPSSSAAYNVTEEEAVIVVKAFAWFMDNVRGILKVLTDEEG